MVLSRFFYWLVRTQKVKRGLPVLRLNRLRLGCSLVLMACGYERGAASRISRHEAVEAAVPPSTVCPGPPHSCKRNGSWVL